MTHLPVKRLAYSPETLRRLADKAVRLDMTPEPDLLRIRALLAVLTREDIRALAIEHDFAVTDRRRPTPKRRKIAP